MKQKSCLFIKRVEENENLKEVSYVEHLHLKKTALNTILFLAYGETHRKKSKLNASEKTSLQKGIKRNRGNARWTIYENLSGNGFIETNGTKYPLQPGDVFLLQPFSCARIYTEEDKLLMGRYICIYDTMLMAAMSSSLSIKAAGIFHSRQKSCVHDLFNKVKNIVTEAAPSEELTKELSLICYELLYTLSAEKKEEESDPKFESFLRQLSATCSQAHTLTSMAKACGVTTRTLIRLFQAKLSISPIQYLINIRLDYAAMLLRQADYTYTVKTIAEKCGYRNIPFFSREFKKKFSISPKEYMKKYRINDK